ncbi:MAG: TonB-dependent receptor plug domain-containing protein, partial [Pollutimonas bauzanensis]
MNSPRCLSDRALVPTSGAVLKQLPLAMAMLACPCMAMAQADAAGPRNAQELSTITVTATMSEHDTRTAPASVTVISKEELEIRNPADLLEAVRGEPGITLAPRQVGGRKTISLRGLEGRHVLTLIDGRRISATDDVVGHSDYQYSWLPMSAVERIEVIRGPMSTLYGSEALGGVINLITRKPTDHWEGSVSLNGSALTDGDSGDHGGSAAVYAAGPAGDRLILRVNAETARRPKIAEKEDPRYTELEGSKSNTGGLGAILKLTDQQTLDLSYSKGEERRYYDTDSSGVFYENRYNIDRSLADVTWRGDFDSWKGQLRAYRSEIDITNSRSNGIASTRPQNMKEEVADGFATTTWGSHKLTAGGELRSEALKNAGLVGGKDDALHKALFLQDEFSLTRQLTLTAGLRYDHHEIFGNEISPRAYLVWEASPDLVIIEAYTPDDEIIA